MIIISKIHLLYRLHKDNLTCTWAKAKLDGQQSELRPSTTARVSTLNNHPSVLSKGCFIARHVLSQWCNDRGHICCVTFGLEKSHFLEGPFPAVTEYVFLSACASRGLGSLWITCWGWLPDRGKLKWVLWLAWAARLERNRCCLLALAGVPMAAEACDWPREDTTALGGSWWLMPGIFVGRGREGWRGKRAPKWADHLDLEPQRLTWQSRSEQQRTEDSQSADFPSPAFSLAARQQTQAIRRDFLEALQLWVFPPNLGGLFLWKEKVDQKAQTHRE